MIKRKRTYTDCERERGKTSGKKEKFKREVFSSYGVKVCVRGTNRLKKTDRERRAIERKKESERKSDNQNVRFRQRVQSYSAWYGSFLVCFKPA